MRDELAVVILAGGEGQRIGGGKPLRTFHGERLVDRAILLARQWSEKVAVAVRDPAQVSDVSAELIFDADVPGPFGGLISALDFARGLGCGFVLTIPADMPFLPADLADRLSAAMGDKRCAAAASGGHLHPVCALWHATGSGALAESYAAVGRGSLNGFAEQLGFVTVEWPAEPLDPFFNINTADDLAEAMRIGT